MNYSKLKSYYNLLNSRAYCGFMHSKVLMPSKVHEIIGKMRKLSIEKLDS